MQVGDLVTDHWGHMGIILRQVGSIDRWEVYWQTGRIHQLFGNNLIPMETAKTKTDKKCP